MTTDRAALVERLRERSQNLWTTDAELRSNQLFKEAADTITTLRNEVLEEAAGRVSYIPEAYHAIRALKGD
jgi:hypothetical protein